MKILMITPSMQVSENSGIGLATGEIAQQLAKTHSLSIIQSGDTLPTQETNERKSVKSDFSVQQTVQDIVKTIAVPIEVYNTSNLAEQDSATSLSVKKHLTEFTEEVVREVSDYPIDIIYAHDWVSFAAGMELKKRFKKPLVLHAHTMDIDRISSPHHSWVFETEREAFEAADAIITVSKYCADRLIMHYRIRPEKIQVVHNATNPLKVKKRPTNRFREPLIVFAGRLAEQKGGRRFISIAENVLENHPNARFVMAGEGELKKDLIELAAQKGIGDRVHFTGQLAQEELWNLFSEADIFCVPATSEPFGLAALEAAAIGLPIVLSEQSGVLEVLPKAFSHDFQDIDGFTKTISQIIAKAVKTKSSEEANKKAALSRTWANVAQEVADILTANS